MNGIIVVGTMKEDNGYIDIDITVTNTKGKEARKISGSTPILQKGRYLSKDIPLFDLLNEIYLRVTQ